MKACSTEAFSIDAKYAKFPDLVLAYIWNIEHPEKQTTFAMSYSEALGIADEMGWTRTTSWANGSYANTQPGAKLKALLLRYRSTPARWRELVLGKPSAEGATVPPPSRPSPLLASAPEAVPAVSFGEQRSQRDVMRDIHARFRADHERIIEEYAAAERRGEVRRSSNAADRDRESYARALLADGLKKGWLR